MRLAVDMSGKQVGALTVRARAGSIGSLAAWLCECACGATKVIVGAYIRNGSVRSCGCQRLALFAASPYAVAKAANAAHAPSYKSWSAMMSRCYRAGTNGYARYGGAGITVCDRWRESFAAFISDMGPRPSLGHSIDRIDNGGNYEPGNCRWATRREQNSNRRDSVRITLNGDTRTRAEWSRALGVSHGTLYNRQRKGLPVDAILSTRITPRNERGIRR